jgi:hypothetical protein
MRKSPRGESLGKSLFLLDAPFLDNYDEIEKLIWRIPLL